MSKRPYKEYLKTGKGEDFNYQAFRRLRREYGLNNYNQQPENIDPDVSMSNTEGDEDLNSESTDIENINTIFDESPARAKEFVIAVDESNESEDSMLFEVIDNLNLDNDFYNHNLRDSIRYPKSFQDLLSDDKLMQIVSMPVNKSYGEILLMVLKYCLSNKLPLTALSNLLRLVNTMFPQPILPESRYILDKIFNPKISSEFHAVCLKCKMYIGKLEKLHPTVTCENCGELIEISTPSSLNYFVMINPSEAIECLLNEHANYYLHVLNDNIHETGHIKDIYDGKRYRNFIKKLPPGEKYITTTFNTDGAPRFECSNYSIWPIYLQIHQIPPQARLNNVITCAMWFGKDKPEMISFLEPFVAEMNNLSDKGISCMIKNELCIIKVYPLIASVDSVARAPMQGIKQFNGKYGCNWCLHPGEYHSGSMKYPMQENVPEERDMHTTLEHIEAVANGNVEDIYGVKYGSKLINLHHFNIIKSFVPDYMHCILAGVAKQLTENIMSFLTNAEREILDSVLNEIKVPYQISRLTRTLSDRNDWKAREWENFLLFYSFPLFKLLLNQRFIKYWSLLIESIYILLQQDITYDELNKAQEMLLEFNFQTEEIFSKSVMTYNIHLLLHITDSVINWGPLWAHSTFPFEAANHELLQAIHCAKGVNQQIVRYINLQRLVKNLERHIYPNCSHLVREYCEDIVQIRLKKSLKISSVTYLGKEVNIKEEVLLKFNLSVDNTAAFARMVKDGCAYMSHKIKNKRSDNSFAQLLDNRYIKINRFLVDSISKREITMCNIIKTMRVQEYKLMHLIRSIETEVIVIETECIARICISFSVKKDNYIIPVPNLLHY